MHDRKEDATAKNGTDAVWMAGKSFFRSLRQGKPLPFLPDGEIMEAVTVKKG